MILELVSCQGLSRRASAIHPIPGSRNISWLISNLVRKWVSAFLLQGPGLGPAYLAAYTGKSLILLDLGCGREAFNAIISGMMVSHSSAVPSHTGREGCLLLLFVVALTLVDHNTPCRPLLLFLGKTWGILVVGLIERLRGIAICVCGGVVRI